MTMSIVLYEFIFQLYVVSRCHFTIFVIFPPKWQIQTSIFNSLDAETIVWALVMTDIYTADIHGS